MLNSHLVHPVISTQTIYDSYRKLIECFSLFIFLLSLCFPLNANENSIQDHNLKAVYLFRFVLLTNWGEFKPQDNKYHLCTQGSSKVTEALNQLVIKQQNRANVISFKSIEKIAVSSCHLIYTTTQKPKLLAHLKTLYPHALLIGESAAFIHAGGSIAFIKENNRIKPLISLNNLVPTGLSLRSQLLSVSDLADNKEAQ